MLKAIGKMTDEIARIMDGKLYGIWLCGSAAMDDFRLGWSDIDVIALTDGAISEKQARRLLTLRQDMLKKEPGNKYYRSFEGVIADRDEYGTRSFTMLVYWGTSGQRITDAYTPDAFSEFELARYGKVLYGDRPWPFPPPEKEELVRAVKKHFDSIRQYAVTTDGSLYSCGWLLDIARCVYTLRYGDVISKTCAGEWALEEHLFPREEALERTLEIRGAPLRYKDSESVKDWLKTLGPVVQAYADVLENELRRAPS